MFDTKFGAELKQKAAGFDGTHLIQQLLQEGKSVRALYRTSVPQTLAGLNGIRVGKRRYPGYQCLWEAMEGVDQVYHCAAIVSFHPTQKNLLNKTNIEGTANVVNACISQGYKSFYL